MGALPSENDLVSALAVTILFFNVFSVGDAAICPPPLLSPRFFFFFFDCCHGVAVFFLLNCFHDDAVLKYFHDVCCVLTYTWYDLISVFFCCRNAAIFPVDDPSAAPLVGDATIVVVNDARHQLEANFLQRTVPYFFELTGGHPTVAAGGRYRWAKVSLPPTTQPLRTVRTAHFPCLALMAVSMLLGVFCRPGPSLAYPPRFSPLSCSPCLALGTIMAFLSTRTAMLSDENVLTP